MITYPAIFNQHIVKIPPVLHQLRWQIFGEKGLDRNRFLKVFQDIFRSLAQGVLFVFGKIETKINLVCQQVYYNNNGDDQENCYLYFA